jgi:cellulose synthase/poly-beta-1,6-N-acetylglucosamine synthase-like glycosyltransferase
MQRHSSAGSLRILTPWLLGCGLVFFGFVLPWMRHINLDSPALAILCDVSAGIWVIVLCWSWYHLVCQLSSVFAPNGPDRSVSQPAADADQTRFVLFYLTCDDFQEACCDSCLQQEHYPANKYRVVICDDSADRTYQLRVKAFFTTRPYVSLFRRGNRDGFKAGNLKAAFKEEVAKSSNPEEWVVIVDADQTLPKDYLKKLDVVLRHQPDDIGFVQARNSCASPRSDQQSGADSRFQEYFGFEVDVFYTRDLRARLTFGLTPFLGHGAAVRTRIWSEIGGFPLVVSEDFAFTVSCVNGGYRGVYAPEVVSYETFPRDFSAFVIRLTKFAAGTAELFRSGETQTFLKKAPLAQRLDFVMLLAWYPLMPFVLGNLYLSAFVCYRLSAIGVSLLHPAMPYLFLLMFALHIFVLWSCDGEGGTIAPFSRAAKFWFQAVALYQSTIPMAAWSFVRFMFGGSPGFSRTPKEDGDPIHSRADAVMLGIGLAGLLAAFWWRSPFSFLVGSHSASHILFPLFRWINVDNLRGRIARVLLWLPGVMLIAALLAMWAFTKFQVSIPRLR